MTKKSFHRLFLAAATGAALCGLVSCGGGSTYAKAKPNLPPIAKGHGRVFVYRPSSLGFGVRPEVKIDDKVAGTSFGQGFFYSDQVPGSHQISISTEWKHKNTFSVKSGQPTFVECKVVPGVLAGHIIPNQVETATGEANIQDCKLPE